MGLRLAEGIDLSRYATIAGRRSIRRGFRFLRDGGAIEVTEGGRLRVTPSGFPLLDAVVADLAA